MGKARGHVLRLALVLEYLWWAGSTNPEPVEVGRRTLEAAIMLVTDYFLPTAERVFGDAAVPEEERHARELANWIVETRPKTVNVTTIRDNARLPSFRKSSDVKAACRYLSEAKWLIEPGHTGTGRPRGDYVVNPKLWDALGLT